MYVCMARFSLSLLAAREKSVPRLISPKYILQEKACGRFLSCVADSVRSVFCASTVSFGASNLRPDRADGQKVSAFFKNMDGHNGRQQVSVPQKGEEQQEV